MIIVPGMPRYLFYFSYLGTHFSGLQFQPNGLTVEAVLRHAMGAVLRKAPESVVLRSSSRTDAGVHALMNSASVDIPRRDLFNDEKITPAQPPTEYDPEYLQAAINYILTDANLDVRITGCRIVSDDFCCRNHALHRSYLYRLAVLKTEYNREPSHLYHPDCILPLIEQNRCWPIRSNFNLDRFKEAAQEFIGEKNVASFMGSPVNNIKSFQRRKLKNPNLLIAEPQMLTMRHMKHIAIERGRPLLDAQYEPFSDCFNFFDVSFVAKSFVYRQIRKMIGVLVGVAQGKMSISDVRWMLNNPHHENFGRFPIDLAPAGGLYLQEIVYDPKDFTQPKPIVYDDYEETTTAADATMSQKLKS